MLNQKPYNRNKNVALCMYIYIPQKKKKKRITEANKKQNKKAPN